MVYFVSLDDFDDPCKYGFVIVSCSYLRCVELSREKN